MGLHPIVQGRLTFFSQRGYFLIDAHNTLSVASICRVFVNNDEKIKKDSIYLSATTDYLYCCSFLSSVKDSTIFIIDNNNFYQRGTYYFIPLGLAAFYFTFSILKIYDKLKFTSDINERRQINYLALFVVLPVVAAVFQMLHFGLSIIWISVVISLLIVFINVQNRQILTDSLTGLNNRMQFEKYVSALIKDAKSIGKYMPYCN